LLLLDKETNKDINNFKKLCKKGVIQRLDVPNKEDIINFCNNTNTNTNDKITSDILDYKILIKNFIKEYKKWNKDQNIEKQLKLKSLSKKIKDIEKTKKHYINNKVKDIILKDNISNDEINETLELIVTELQNKLSIKNNEIEEFNKYDNDIESWKKKIEASNKIINNNKSNILKLAEQKMPIEIMNKIHEYQSSLCTSSSSSSSSKINKKDKDNLDKDKDNLDKDNILSMLTSIINVLLVNSNNNDNNLEEDNLEEDNLEEDNDMNDNIKKVLNKKDIILILNLLKSIKKKYTIEYEKGFIDWTKQYIKDDKDNEEKQLELKNNNKSEQKRIDKYELKISKANKELLNRKKIQLDILDIEKKLKDIEKDKSSYKYNLNLDNDINKIEVQCDTIESELSSGDNEISLYIEKLESLWSNINENMLKTKDLNLEKLNLDRISVNLDNLLQQLEDNNNISSKILEYTKKKDKLNEEYNKLTAETQTLRDKYSSNKGQLKKMKEDCDIKREKERMLYLLEIYKIAIKFIPMILINKIKPILSRKVNDLLNVVTNFTLEFDFDDNKIDIYLYRPSYNKKKIIINNSSGFERFISSIAIRLALIEISKLPSPNVMIIDEGWSCFDSENLNNMDIILDHLKQKFDFILTISHLQLIRQHCDIQIGLTKDNDGFSQVKFG
jgi:hypothetical protein